MFIDVVGIPAPQGSKKSIGNNRFVETSKKLPAWRKAVKEAALKVLETEQKIEGPVWLELDFFVPRPKTVSVEQRPWPITPPDSSKLLRAVEDSLTDAGVWVDDSYVVDVHVREFYADCREPGCAIRVGLVDWLPDN